MNIEKLPTNFVGTGEVKGFEFEMLMRGDKTLLFAVQCDQITHYEVFEVRSTAKMVSFEKRQYSETDFKERYPKANDFGVWAWTFKHLESSIIKFNGHEG